MLSSRLTTGWALVLIFALLLVPRSTSANASQPWDDGHPVGEPIEALSELTIVHERLHIDARPLAEGRRVEVTARYEIRCDAPRVRSPLVFVSPAIEEGAVTLDGRPLPLEVRGADALPLSWRSPKGAPDFIGDYRDYTQPIERVLAFFAEFERGEHVLEVHYEAEPVREHHRTLVDMKLAYVLAPAREWGGFGTLDVVVDVPLGWALASEPALTPSEDAWRGSFEGIPADALKLAFRPPTPTMRLAIPWLVVLAGLWGCWRAAVAVGRRAVRRAWGGATWVVMALVLAAAGTGVTVLAMVVGRGLFALTIPSFLLARDTDYDHLFLGFIMALVGGVVTLAGLLWARAKTNPWPEELVP